MKKEIFLILFAASLASSCKEEGIEPVASDIDWTIPNERSFYMGFTAFPYDVTPQATLQSYTNQAQNGDILLSHFDHGVPWNEALHDLPFPNSVQTAIDEAIDNRTQAHKVFLTATATDTQREQLAKYWNDSGTHQDLPEYWNTKSFNSLEVIKAYKNYCHRIIDAIQPDYFAFGIEIDHAFLDNTQSFQDYLQFADSIYSDLKASYPNTPILLTFGDQSFNKNKEELRQITSQLLAYSDMIAVSSYPFWIYEYPNRDANPKLIDNNWLAEMRQLAPDKPFAVSETGYCAERLFLGNYGVDIQGSELWQKEYVQKLLTEADKLNAEFVLWFVYRDLDWLENNLPQPSEALKIWRDNGLQDESGNRRPAHDIWDSWKALPVN